MPRHRTAWLVLAASLILTVVVTTVVSASARARDEGRFRNAVQAAHDRIVGRLDVYTAMLTGSTGLFMASDTVTAAEFEAYFSVQNLSRSFPGIRAVGFNARTETGLEGERDESYEAIYVESVNGSGQAAVGLDMYAEPTRRSAMQRARDYGEPAISGRVDLRFTDDGRSPAGFLLFVPVYTHFAPETVEERRRTLVGFVFAAVRSVDLFAGVFGSEEKPRVSFAVHDGTSVAPGALLYSSPSAERHRPAYSGSTQMQIAGHTWTVTYVTQPAFDRLTHRSMVPLVLIAGALFSTWLFWLARTLAREREGAFDASRAKSAFLANMSHELRTPLNAIGGYVDLMRLGVPDPVTAAQQVYLVRIQRAQKHLLGLINDVLSFSKIEAGRVDYVLGDAHVATIVTDALAMVQPNADARSLSLASCGGPDVWVAADEEKARQILLNLLSNAIKFTNAGGRVDVLWRVVGDRVEVSVRDNGIGIDRTHQVRIFDAFHQADPRLTREREGTGLGLSISRALAQGMNGDVTVLSEPGKGSVFTLTLPRARNAVHA